MTVFNSHGGGCVIIGNGIAISHSGTTPKLLHTTQESRQIGLGFYFNLFDDFLFPYHVYVNLTIDILCFSSYSKYRDSWLTLANKEVMRKYGEWPMLGAMATVTSVNGVWINMGF